MIVMLCRNRVRSFEVWKKVFDDHAPAHREAGLRLVHLWRDLGDPDTVLFLFEVSDLERARAFVATPEAAEAGIKAGVLEGEYRFLRESPAD